MPFTQIICIMNPAAGTQRGVREDVLRTWKKMGVACELWETARAEHATELAERAKQSDADLVVGIGGDGTLNEIGRALVGSDVPLGCIPVGSGNALARALGISRRPAEACRQLLSGEICALDIGRVGDAFFLSTAGIGLDAEVARRYAARSGKHRGLLPYVAMTIRALHTFRPEPLRLILDDAETVDVQPLLLAVANTAQYGNGLTIAPGAMPDDGLLTICAIAHPGWLRMGGHMVRLLNGTIHKERSVSLFTARKIRVEREASGWMQFDGEARMAPDVLEFGLLPKALRMVLPAQNCAPWRK